MSATATPAHSYNKGKGRKGGKGKGNGRQNDGGNGNNQRGTGRDPDNSRNGANSAIVTRKNDSPFLRAFGTTGRQELYENDAAIQMMIRNTMTLWLVLYNIELENQGFKVDNFYVFISLVSTKDERRAAFKKAKNNLKAKADAGDAGAQNKIKGFTIDKMSVWTGPQNMGAFPTIKPGVQLPQDIYGRIAPRWNHMIRVLTNQGKQGVPPEFNTVLTTPASFQLLDKYCILPGQEANSSQHEKLNFEKIRTQFIADCSNAVIQGVKSVLLGQKPIAFAGAAVSSPQTSTVAAAATNTSTPTTAATVPSAAGEAPANTAPPSSSPGGGAGQGTDSTSGGVSQQGFSYGAATDDELIAQQLTNVQAMDM